MPYKRTMSKSRLENIMFNLRECFDGEPWYGISVMERLNGIDWETANKSRPGTKSIAVILRHMINWRIFVLKKLQGDETYQIKINGPMDWPDVQIHNPGEWEDMLDQLKLVQEEIIKDLALRTDAFLDQKVPGKPHNFRVLLEGINQHDIYHLGQIGLLNSMKGK